MEGVGGNNKAKKQFDGELEGAANIFFGGMQTRLIKYVAISTFD